MNKQALDKFTPAELTQEQKAKQAEIVAAVREGEYQPELSVLQEEYMAKAKVR